MSSVICTVSTVYMFVVCHVPVGSATRIPRPGVAALYGTMSAAYMYVICLTRGIVQCRRYICMLYVTCRWAPPPGPPDPVLMHCMAQRRHMYVCCMSDTWHCIMSVVYMYVVRHVPDGRHGDRHRDSGARSTRPLNVQQIDSCHLIVMQAKYISFLCTIWKVIRVHWL